MNKVNMIMQAKGGCGKSLSASILAQFLIARFQDENKKLLVVDIDQENPTLSQYKALNVLKVSVMGEGRAIDPKMFDTLMMNIVEFDGDVVLDTGANTFSALMAYIIENSVFDVIKESGKEVIIHTVVGGGDVLYDTANGFADIASYVTGNMVLWQNEHFGEMRAISGVAFADSKVLLENKGKLIGEVILQKRTAATFGADVNKMTSMRLTFDEVDASTSFNFMERNRLKIVRKDMFDQLGSIAGL